MYIIERNANADGGRAPLQTWDWALPEGYAWCPDAFFDVYYSTNPAGFVDMTVEGDTVTAMEVNWDAYHAYVAAHPVAPDPETELTADELIDIMLGVSRYE